MLDKYYQLVTNQNDKKAELYIYGDISSLDYDSSKSTSANSLVRALAELTDIDEINVYINSCGGEVGEGLAIYNALKRHSAKVTTYCDGLAASIASVIFMAGDERVMSNSSLLFVHNAWTYTAGNASELRKSADDLDKLTKASINAYLEHVNIDEVELKQLLDEETWLDATECIDKGFATKIVQSKSNKNVNQSVKQRIFEQLKSKQSQKGELSPVAPVQPHKENLFINLLESLVEK